MSEKKKPPMPKPPQPIRNDTRHVITNSKEKIPPKK